MALGRANQCGEADRRMECLGGGYVWAPTAPLPEKASLLPFSDIASWDLVQTVESLLLDILRGPAVGGIPADLGSALLFQGKARGQRPPGWERVRQLETT